MTNNIITKYMGITEVGTSLASEVLTADVDLSIYNYVDFVLSISKGTAGATIVKAMAKKSNETAGVAISFREKLGDGVVYKKIDSDGIALNLDGLSSQTYVFRVTTANLAKGEFSKVALDINAIESSDLKCNVTAVLYEPRYTD